MSDHTPVGKHARMFFQKFRQRDDQSRRPALDAGRTLADGILETYIEWREAVVDVSDTYARWVHAPAGEVEHWFCMYNLALDQEDAAASAYAATMAEGERRRAVGW